MRKWLISVSVAVLLSLVVVMPALAWTVTGTKTKDLSVAGQVEFDSAFSASDGETITVNINPLDDPSVTITDVTLEKVTPKPKAGCAGCSATVVSGTGTQSVNVTLANTRTGKSTFHLWLHLSTGEHLGVNVKFGR